MVGHILSCVWDFELLYSFKCSWCLDLEYKPNYSFVQNFTFKNVNASTFLPNTRIVNKCKLGKWRGCREGYIINVLFGRKWWFVKNNENEELRGKETGNKKLLEKTQKKMVKTCLSSKQNSTMGDWAKRSTLSRSLFNGSFLNTLKCMPPSFA